MNIGLIGAGRMAQALVKGVIKSGFAKPETIIASCHPQDMHHLEQFIHLGCKTTTVNKELAEKSDVVILVVKPQIIGQVLPEISSEISEKKLIISIAAGVPLLKLKQPMPPKSRIIRVMPNTPCVVLEGASVFSRGECATPDDVAFTKKLFSSVGLCEEVPESHMDAVTGISGSGPAYIYMVIEAMADGGVKMGLPRDLSLKLAAQCVLGSAKMVLAEDRHPGSLKDDVASPGGSTIHGLHLLEKGAVRSLFISAVEEATNTARRLSGNSK